MSMKRMLSVFLTIAMAVSVMPTGIIGMSVNAESSEIYTITYHLDGGTNALKNPDVYTAEDVITLADAEKTGYDFAGWFLDARKTEEITRISDMAEHLTLYAKFIPKTYSATFDDNGATQSSPLTLTLDTVETITVNNGDVIDPYAISIPTKSGYVFLGWYYGEELVTEPFQMDSDVTLTPKWSECTWTNEFKIPSTPQILILGENIREANIHSGSDTKVVSLSGQQIYYEHPDGDSYSYSEVHTTYIYVSGGYTTVNYSGKGYSACRSSLTNPGGGFGGSIYRHYYLNSYFAISNVTTGKTLVTIGDSTYSTSSTSSSNSNYTTPYSKSGALTVAPGTLLRVTAYTSWNAGFSGTAYAYGSISLGQPREAQIVVANERTNTIDFDSYINTPSVSKTGYKFLGWYDSQGNQMTDTWQYTTDQTFTAKWQPQAYDITYELDGGINNPSNPSAYTIEDTISLRDPTKPGYTFKGWYSDADFTTAVTSIAEKTGNMTLYAKWEANTYNLIMDANDGVFGPKVTFISDGKEIKSCYLYEQDAVVAYRPDNKKGYIFAGWYENDTFTSLFEFNQKITNDITLYAKWVECDSNIINVESVEEFDVSVQGKNEQLYAFVPLVDGEITVTSESNDLDLYGILYDASRNILITADDISSTDLDFSYTYSVKAGQLYYISVKGNTVSTVGQAAISIVWVGNCAITGTTYQNRQIKVVYDKNYKLPQKPVREGYVFLGWFDENNTQITDGKWNFVTDKTLTAKWEEATYHTVVFKDVDGTVISSETYYFSEDIVAPALPTKDPDEIYIYHAKWDNDYTGVCTGDMVYSPVFDTEYVEYTVIFVDEDGTELSKGTYHWGDAVTPPAAPTKATDANYANTYTFAGWDNSVVDCVGNATYTATYTAVPLKQLVVTSLPEKVRYRSGESLDVTGLALQLVYADGTIISLDSVDARCVSADLSTSGKKAAVIAIAGVSVEFEVYVHDVVDAAVNVDSSLYPESSHNYSNSLDETKIFTYPGAQSLVVTFNSQTSVENNYDYIYIYDGAGNQVAKYTGTTAANKTLTIPGDTFRVRLTSDVSVVSYGYAFSNIQAVVKNAGEIIHKPVTDPATVTCTQGGLTEGSHCEICEDVLVAQEEVAALGHRHQAAFTWSADHTSCAATITCERGCGLFEVLNCTVTRSKPDQAQTTHTAVAEYDGVRFTDVLTCDNFLIVFKDWNGAQISRAYYHTGDAVVIPCDPVRAADNTYTYAFAGWDKAVADCVGNATYTATYTPTYIDYTVVFKGWDGTVLSTKTYHYGDEVTAPAAPIKERDNMYTYVFDGWDKTVIDCVGHATYTATYTPVYISYTVVFKDWDGKSISVKRYHYGDRVVAPADPIREADNTYTYAFAGWDKDVENCTGRAIYTATYKATYVDYTVVFKDWDGTPLSTSTYHYGDRVVAPADPIREADNTYTYAFDGWDKEVVDCAGHATYTATYTPIYISYIVTFKDWDGTPLSTSTYHYGDRVVAPADPIREADNTYTYAFGGWGNVVNCAGDATYTATYVPTYIGYTVVFKNWDGSVISSLTYHWGETIAAPVTPTKAADNTYTYAFAGWDVPVVACAGNATYTATYTPAYIDYTVVFKDWDGTVLSEKTYHFGDAVTVPAAPVRAADNTYTYTFGGWDAPIVACAGNATYTATYVPAYIDYTVVFKDWNGTVIRSDVYHWGDTVTAPANPVRAYDEHYIYTFTGWNTAVTACGGNAVYTATYGKSAIAIASIAVTTKPNKVTYLEGETFDATGMVVMAYYNNNTSKVVTDYTLSGYDATPGDKTITVTYGDKSDSFTVTVKRDALLGDVDGNGKIDSTDARLVLQYAVKKVGASALDVDLADVDGNGKVDSTDARLILQYAVKKIDAFPKA